MTSYPGLFTSILHTIVKIVAAILIAVFMAWSMCHRPPKPEPFNSRTDQIFLLGDSMFKNDHYVPGGKSVTDHLLRKLPDSEHAITVYAKNGATISDVYSQLNRISRSADSISTNIFVSVGGNDLLSLASYTTFKYDQPAYDDLFSKYKLLMEKIRREFPESKLHLATIYYPSGSDKALKKIISNWNKQVRCYVGSSIHIKTPVVQRPTYVPVDEYLVEPLDFVRTIEPSSTGGEKIAKLIAKSVGRR